MRRPMPLLILLTLTFCGLTSRAQEPCTLVQTLDDGDLIVNCAGVEYRAITADHARVLAGEKAERSTLLTQAPVLQAKITALEDANARLTQDAQLADRQRQIAATQANNYRVMYESEQALRLQAEKFLVRGRVSKFFDKPAVQIIFKVGLPILELARRR